MQRSALCRSRRELSNEYLLAKFRFDTAENEPCEVCPLSVYRSPRFTLGKELGKGSFGVVYAGTDDSSDEPVAIKDITSRRAAAGRAQLLAKSSSTTGGIKKVEQTAPLRDGPAGWAWDF